MPEKKTEARDGEKDLHTHRNGIWWHEAPLPFRWHRCRWWSAVWFSGGMTCLQRCACGAIRYDDGPWREKNSRRKDKSR